ncbi:MAG TPA: hypothetical protein VGR68_07940 [Actinomycetota bacterium]|nr:hypothetical protein [Actinomycetota bacterium]
MNIGMVSTRFAGTDGVTLEAAKLAEVLKEAGHEVVWFAGELGERFQRTCVPEILETAFPPALAGMQHVVIQSSARDELARRRGVLATVLPNVMDFERGPATA